ncbi:cysteine rich repeat-containing protein [Ancylobacter defluvii]|uniref:Cysteine rich repeat protein n=1 Tax=Ancylobacter defluvii TaxID=1282440 RepID=A0A9W6NCU5_9HYPH|nr:cysteine rich repeat-containing protein [Ancylobacter defluvii]MBS7586734.1 hypothetical protein [Ancylobacter defluvii]GLK86035.1 hypothetical protein GCM10017653_41050 [Ancylobacter defluvii]
MNAVPVSRVLLVLAFAGLTSAAGAQNLSRSQMQALRTACEADIRAVCPGVQPGGGRLLQCIQANPEKVSQPCKEALASIQAARAQ